MVNQSIQEKMRIVWSSSDLLTSTRVTGNSGEKGTNKSGININLGENNTRATDDIDLGATLKTIAENFSRQKSTKTAFKRKYILTRNTRFDVWYDRLKNDLESIHLLDVIDSNVTIQGEYSIERRIAREKQVRDIIIGLLDDRYHKMISTRILHLHFNLA